MSDVFAPKTEPAASIYAAFHLESSKRKARSIDEWIEAERNAVWQAACDYAQKHGLSVPTINQIQNAEVSAMGHIDYAAKWAHGVARLLLEAKAQPDQQSNLEA